MCGNDLNYWKENSFWNHIEKNHEAIRKMKIHIFIGDKDGLYDSNNKLHNYLNELKIEHSYTVFPGEGHTGVKRYIKSNNFENFKFYKTLLEIPDR
jgi:enterochelin esterase-like enzyme